MTEDRAPYRVGGTTDGTVLNVAKCPGCKKDIMTMAVKSLPGEVTSTGKRLPCVALCCPVCNTVLGEQIDPVMINSAYTKGMAEVGRKARGE